MKYIKFLVFFIFIYNLCYSQNCTSEAPRNIKQLDVGYFQSPFGIVVIKGEYGIWHKTNILSNSNATQITKPFIICEGFDPIGSMELGCIYESINSRGNVNFLEYLRIDGFDIIILNLKTNGIEIEKNANQTT